METKLLNAVEAAKILGTSPGTLAVWRNRTRRGTMKRPIPFITIAGAIRYDSADIEKYINQGRVGGGDSPLNGIKTSL